MEYCQLKHYLVFIFIIVLSFASAQQIKQEFRNINLNQGLSHPDVTDLLQDDNGFIWVSTLSGLNRYDGHEMKSFSRNQQGYRNVNLNRIDKLSYKNGSIFMATQGGLVEFDIKTEKIITYNSDDKPTKNIITNAITSVLAWTDSLIWVIQDNKLHLLEINSKTKQSKLIKLNLPSDLRCTSLAIDLEGNCWIGSNNGLIKASKVGKVLKLTPITLLAEDNKVIQDVRSLHFQRNKLIVGGINKVWVSENINFKSDRLNGTTFRIPTANLLLKNGSTFVVKSVVSFQDQIWIGTSLGMFYLLSSKFIDNPALVTLSSSNITNMIVDKGGCLWVGAYGGGVSVLDLNPKKFYSLNFSQFKNTNFASPNQIRAILEDDLSGNLWVGTLDAGLIFHDFSTGISQQYLNQSENKYSLISNSIRSLAKDKKERIWVGTESGISIMKNNIFQNLKHEKENPNSLSGNSISSIGVDVFGQVWAGSWNNGLNKIIEINDKFEIERFYEGAKGLSSSKITFIYTDPIRPEVLVGTTKGLDHIYLQPDGSVSHIYQYRGSSDYAKSLSADYIWPIVRLDQLTFGVGTIGGGLNFVKILGDGKYEAESLTTENGLLSNDVEGLLLDNKGNLWMSSNGGGITMINPKTKKLVNFDKNDGLASNVFKIGASTKGRDGKLYFGGVNGINYFYPDQINISQYVPKALISDILVNNKPYKEVIANLSKPNELVLNHLQNSITIKFSALDYANPDKCLYRFQLEGVDKNVIERDGRNPQMSYSNLEYGTYAFKLFVSNHDGIWPTKPTVLKIIVKPPFYKTIFAKALYILILSVILWMIYQYQIRWFKLKNSLAIKSLDERKAEEIHQIRLQFFTNISHELRTPLTLIISPIEKLLRDNMDSETRNKCYQIIHRNSTRLLTLVNELLDFRKAEAGVTKLRASETYLNTFISGICNEFEEALKEKDLEFQLKLHDKDEKLWIDRAILEKVMVNIISNSIKYTNRFKSILLESNASSTPLFQETLQIGTESPYRQYYWIRILDNGLGISGEDLPNVFEKFYRVSEIENQKTTGSGIGLALVKSLILLHHGILKVSSKIGNGTEFLIGIPHGTSHFKPEELLKIPDYSLGDSSITALDGHQIMNLPLEDLLASESEEQIINVKKLLIVEDNADLRHFIADSFMGQYQVIEAADGLLGWQLAQEELPDIIISDIMMPEMNGIELCHQIKDNLETSHIPVILLTAKTSDESKIEGSETGADAYITKPFSFKLLQITIENLLESRRKLKELYAHDALLEVREVGTTKRDKEFIESIIRIVEKNLDNSELEIEDIARDLSMSRSKLYTKIHSLTGQPVGNFVRKVRLKTAAKILVSENVSITEVMDRVGIQSQSYFTKAFKKEFGKTPTQYINDFVN